jgi:hypothetical protein
VGRIRKRKRWVDAEDDFNDEFSGMFAKMAAVVKQVAAPLFSQSLQSSQSVARQEGRAVLLNLDKKGNRGREKGRRDKDKVICNCGAEERHQQLVKEGKRRSQCRRKHTKTCPVFVWAEANRRRRKLEKAATAANTLLGGGVAKSGKRKRGKGGKMK